MFTQNALVAETQKLQKFALRLTRNKTEADDLLQSTCLRALEKADYFQDDTNLFSWTSKIMYNLFVSGYRRKVKFETQYDPEPYISKLSIKPMQDAHMDFSDVQRAMGRMSAEHSKILILVCIEGRTYQETSEILQIPVGTVRSRLSRARTSLQDELGAPSIPAYIECTQLTSKACI